MNEQRKPRGDRKEFCDRCQGRLDDGRGSGVMVIVPLEAHFSGEMCKLPPMVLCGYCMHEVGDWMVQDPYEVALKGESGNA